MDGDNKNLSPTTMALAEARSPMTGESKAFREMEAQGVSVPKFDYGSDTTHNLEQDYGPDIDPFQEAEDENLRLINKERLADTHGDDGDDELSDTERDECGMTKEEIRMMNEERAALLERIAEEDKDGVVASSKRKPSRSPPLKVKPPHKRNLFAEQCQVDGEPWHAQPTVRFYAAKSVLEASKKTEKKEIMTKRRDPFAELDINAVAAPAAVPEKPKEFGKFDINELLAESDDEEETQPNPENPNLFEKGQAFEFLCSTVSDNASKTHSTLVYNSPKNDSPSLKETLASVAAEGTKNLPKDDKNKKKANPRFPPGGKKKCDAIVNSIKKGLECRFKGSNKKLYNKVDIVCCEVYVDQFLEWCDDEAEKYGYLSRNG